MTKNILLAVCLAALFCICMMPSGNHSLQDEKQEALINMLGQSLQNGRTLLAENTEMYLNNIVERVTERPQFKPLSQMATEATSIIAELDEVLLDIDYKLIENAGGSKSSNLENLAPDILKNKTSSKAVLVEQSQGERLVQEVESAQKQLTDLIQELSNLDVPGFYISSDIAIKLKEQLSLKGSQIICQESDNETINTCLSGDESVGTCHAVLQYLRHNAYADLFTFLRFLAKETGSKDMMVYDKFQVLTQSKKPVILQGETFEADIMLGAMSSQAQFSISVNGRSLPVVDGIAKYSARPGSLGQKQYSAIISVSNPLTGEIESFHRDFFYEVVTPGTVIGADKMNVFYIGVDNPIYVAASGVSFNDLKVSVSGGGARLKASEKGRYIVNVTEPWKTSEISVTNTRTGQKIGAYSFRVKRIPDPIAQLANRKTGGFIKAGEMRAQPGMIATLENFDFDARCQIQSYTLHYTKKGKETEEIRGVGSRFSEGVLEAVKSANAGDLYTFLDVKARCPGDKTGRKVNPLAFIIK